MKIILGGMPKSCWQFYFPWDRKGETDLEKIPVRHPAIESRTRFAVQMPFYIRYTD